MPIVSGNSTSQLYPLAGSNADCGPLLIRKTPYVEGIVALQHFGARLKGAINLQGYASWALKLHAVKKDTALQSCALSVPLNSAHKLRTAHASCWQCSAGLKCLRASNAVGRESQARCLIASASSKVTGPDTQGLRSFFQTQGLPALSSVLPLSTCSALGTRASEPGSDLTSSWLERAPDASAMLLQLHAWFGALSTKGYQVPGPFSFQLAWEANASAKAAGCVDKS